MAFEGKLTFIFASYWRTTDNECDSFRCKWKPCVFGSWFQAIRKVWVNCDCPKAWNIYSFAWKQRYFWILSLTIIFHHFPINNKWLFHGYQAILRHTPYRIAVHYNYSKNHNHCSLGSSGSAQAENVFFSRVSWQIQQASYSTDGAARSSRISTSPLCNLNIS